MTVRAARWVVFAGICCTVPWPMHVVEPIFAPAVHYLLLAGVTLAVIAVEGGNGPVPMILAVFGGYALWYLLCSWTVAWIFTRFVLQRLAPAGRGRVVWATVLVGLALAVLVPGYRLPLSRQPRGGLWQALT